ncbi:caspase-1-like [Archocentrus centrarchus]|uniref:caspase-1-like n=1 Tax=Archocentrus centrarchus TaxID=63155 RepID=UPI0011EA24BC|nr:caspase-1-like [Archocentrus centrarchus]
MAVAGISKIHCLFSILDKELHRVRTSFVEKVSETVIKQLLDDLAEDRVLNDGECESVLEKNTTRADNARCLIDIVKRKGPKASNTMIAHIYPVSEKSISSRVALLITNRNFADKNLTRKGAEVDEENMEKLLKYLQYDVVKYNDLTGKGIDEALGQFSKHPKLTETDSVFVVIMSHGMLGIVLCVNHREDKPDEFPVDKICKHLDSKGCPALLNKPKIIIIQACRGEEIGSVLVSDGAEASVVCDDVSGKGPVHGDGIVEDALRSVHKEKDFVYFMSSTPDTKSYRHTKQGSLLIQFIYEVFNTCSKKDDIDELFRKVMRHFENYSSQDALRQMPSKDRETLTKHY